MYTSTPTLLRAGLVSICVFILTKPVYCANALQPLIDQAISNGVSSLTLPPGTYRVDETLRIINASDLTILADGVTMIMEERRQHMFIDNCTNLHIRGMTLDHDPLPFTQATITDHAADWSWLEAHIHAGYPQDPSASSKIEAYDGSTGKLKPNVWTLYNIPIQKLSADEVRLTGMEAYQGNVSIGDVIVMGCPQLIPHGIEVRNSTTSTFETITIHTSTSFSVLETGCHGNQYLDIRITPGPPPLPGGEPRRRSGNADGIHSKHASLGPRIENCLIENLGDDAIAINGDYDLILSGSGASVILASKRDLEMQVGDTVRSYSPSGALSFESTITGIAPVSGYTDELNTVLSTLNIQNPALFEDTYELTLSSSVSVTPGDPICAINRKGNGFQILNNTIRNKRARGILIKAENGLIEGNTIEDNHMGAIVLTPELYWMEAGFSRSVIIRNNLIANSGINPTLWSSIQAGIITVAAEGESGFAPAGGHLNIEISGNRIDSCLGANIFASSVDGLIIRDNVMINTHNENRDHGQGKGVDPDVAVMLINCANVTLERNIIQQFGGTSYLGTTNVTSLSGSGNFATEPVTYANFQLLHQVGAPNEDDDGDTFINMHEFVLGSNPMVQNLVDTPLWIQGGTTPAFCFLSPQSGRAGLQMVIQKSTTLDVEDWVTVATRSGTGAWSSTHSLTTNPHITDPDLETVEVEVSTPAGDPTFYRIRFEEIP